MVAIRLVLLGLGSVIVGQAVGLAAGAMGSNAHLLATGATQFVIIVAFFFASNWKLPRLTWCKGCLLGGVGLGILATVVVWGIYWVASLCGLELKAQASVEALRLASGLPLVLMVMQSVLGAAFAEELYFRGWWLSYLCDYVSGWAAVLILALVFALIHFSSSAFVGLFVLGTILGFGALRLGVSAAMVAHMVFNLVTVVAVRGGWI